MSNERETIPSNISSAYPKTDGTDEKNKDGNVDDSEIIKLAREYREKKQQAVNDNATSEKKKLHTDPKPQLFQPFEQMGNFEKGAVYFFQQYIATNSVQGKVTKIIKNHFSEEKIELSEMELSTYKALTKSIISVLEVQHNQFFIKTFTYFSKHIDEISHSLNQNFENSNNEANSKNYKKIKNHIKTLGSRDTTFQESIINKIDTVLKENKKIADTLSDYDKNASILVNYIENYKNYIIEQEQNLKYEKPLILITKKQAKRTTIIGLIIAISVFITYFVTYIMNQNQ